MRFTIAVAPFVLAAVVAASYDEHYYKAKHDGKYYDNEKSARKAYEKRCKELGGKYEDKHGYSHKKHWAVFRTKDDKPWCREDCDESKKNAKDMTGWVAKSLGWEELKYDNKKHEKKEKKDYSKDEDKKDEHKKDKKDKYSKEKSEHKDDKWSKEKKDEHKEKKYEDKDDKWSKEKKDEHKEKKYEEKDDKWSKEKKDEHKEKEYEGKDGKYSKEKKHEQKDKKYEHKGDDKKCEYKD